MYQTFPMESLFVSAHRGCEHLSKLLRERLKESPHFSRTHRFQSGELIWQPGDPADAVHLLSQGTVELSQGEGKGSVLIRRVQAGEPFGELCVCEERGGQRRSHAVAVDESESTLIRLDDFFAAVQESGEMLRSLVFTFCERLSDAEGRLEVLAQRDAEQRVARLLLHLATTDGVRRDSESGRVALYCSHDQLARQAAMSRSHMTVVLGRFRDRGLVDYAPNRPLVLDEAALKALTEREA